MSELNIWGLPKQNFYKKPSTSLTAAKLWELTPETKNATFEKQKRMNASRPTPSGVISSPDPERQTAIQRIDLPAYHTVAGIAKPSSSQKSIQKIDKRINNSASSEPDDANLTLSSANFES